MTAPAPAPASVPQDHIDTTIALLALAAEDQAEKRVSAAANNTARAQVHALLAVAMLLAERNAQPAEPTPEPAPEPEPTPEEPTDAQLPG